MKEFLVFLLCLTVTSGFVLKVDEEELQWEAWKSFHGKSYATQSEEAMRKAIWKDNLKVRYYESQSGKLAPNYYRGCIIKYSPHTHVQ